MLHFTHLTRDNIIGWAKVNSTLATSVAATKETIDELCNGSPESTAREENTNASPEQL